MSSVQYHLPEHSVITKDFLKDVLVGKKMLMKKADVDTISVPNYDELSVKQLFQEFKKDQKFMMFFPDKLPQGKGPPR